MEKVDEPEEEDEEKTDIKEDEEEDAKVEEDQEAKKPKKQIEKTVWDWVLVNESKPIWSKKWDFIHILWTILFVKNC